MFYKEEIERSLIAARAERVFEKSQRYYESALKACEEWNKSNKEQGSVIYFSKILGELALEESDSKKRLERWTSAIKKLDYQWKINPTFELAEAYAFLSVDCVQDRFCDFESSLRQKFLRNGKNYIDKILNQKINKNMEASLLARKSSILRYLSLIDVSPEFRFKRLNESLRSAQKAVEIDASPSNALELALSEWTLARHETTDEEYVQRLRKTETILLDDIMKSFEPAQLTLARFYRLSYRGLDACENYPRSLDKIINIRRLLRESYIYGEAATQLWYADYPKEIVDVHLFESKTIIETAISSGYRNARLIIDLAYLRAILDGESAGYITLSDLCTEGANISWEHALRLAAEAGPSDFLTLGFALGIDQSSCWTKLGTFVRKFVNDDSLEEVLYRTAMRLDPHDYIALTNLARFLMTKGNIDSLNEAKRLIQKAQNFADRRFTWWRSVWSEIGEIERTTKGEKIIAPKITRYSPTAKNKNITLSSKFKNIKDIRKAFKLVEKLDDVQKRGYELEKLIYELANLAFITVAPSYRFQRIAGGESQVDGYFEHRWEKYRVECKWRETPAERDDIERFLSKLDAVGVSGVLISMAGFSESAVARSKEVRKSKAILLIDGDEIRSAFSSKINFDELITKKRAFFDQKSETYHRVISNNEAA